MKKSKLFFVIAICLFFACSEEESPNYEDVLEFTISSENVEFTKGNSFLLTMEIHNKSNAVIDFESSFTSCFKDINTSIQICNKVDFVEDEHTHDWDTRVKMEIGKGAKIIKQIDLNKIVSSAESSESHLANGDYNIQLIMDIHDHQSPRLNGVKSNEIDLIIK